MQRHISAAILIVSAFLVGCAPIQLKPQPSKPTLYLTQLENVSAQIIATEKFQTQVLRQKPTYGKSWQAREFEIHIGQPLTQAILTYVTAQIPGTRIGHIDDGKAATVKIKPNFDSLQFGVDDKKAVNNTAVFGVLGTGSKASIGAIVTMSATVAIQGKEVHNITIEGKAEKILTFISITEADASEVIGLAIDDAASKLAEKIILLVPDK